MSGLYKTPGVYVEEIPKFPPSIAAVETAIPAFIGYTEKAAKIDPGDLLNQPIRIGSLVEYEFYFGAGPKPTVQEVKLDNAGNFIAADLKDNYFMYDSIRLFYANGGGDCYIVSVGLYQPDGAKDDAHFTDPGAGLEAIKMVDAPTILLFPDAALMPYTNLSNIQKNALLQCEALQDRVAVLDLRADDPKGTDFRDNIGTSALRYGMAYTPWLNIALPKNVSFRDIQGKIRQGGVLTPLENLTTETSIQTTIANLEDIVADVDAVKTAMATLAAPEISLKVKYDKAVRDCVDTPSVANFKAIVEVFYDTALAVNDLVGSITNADFKTAVQSAIASDFKPVVSKIIAIDIEAVTEMTGYTTAIYLGTPYSAASWDTNWGLIFTTNAPAASTLISGATIADQVTSVLDDLSTEFSKLNLILAQAVAENVADRETELNALLRVQFPLYKNILAGLNSVQTSIPPSGAIAGIYAYVDRTRGVWKAPANVSLNLVVGPKVAFTASELDELNVTTTGKSINAVRSFTGKGTLIFGGRTLAGNDNEWRYVNVRRFFNFVEESVKKATEQFVFEPNDARTWVRVQAMIENFLNTLWRQGALQGIKPEHAYYVAVGLGRTMTPLDILEGRMIIEIGMAAVRPAEFIILRFSHKMAES